MREKRESQVESHLWDFLVEPKSGIVVSVRVVFWFLVFWRIKIRNEWSLIVRTSGGGYKMGWGSYREKD